MSDQQLQDDQPMADGMHYSDRSTLPPWKKNILPVTISQILKAKSSPLLEDKCIIIEGKSISAVTFVAHVVSATEKPGGTHYVLEDGTGRMSTMKDLDSLRYYRGQNPEAEEEERKRCAALERTYVEVVGTPQKGKFGTPLLTIISMTPVQDYHQVMFHILNVIYCNILFQKKVWKTSCSADMDFESNEHLSEDLANDMDVDEVPPMLPSCPVLPNVFSPQRQQPYATLEPLQRAIVTQMCYNGNSHVSIAELAQLIQESYGCTQFQFNLALQELLEEAYLTSPLDDGYIILTPRY